MTRPLDLSEAEFRRASAAIAEVMARYLASLETRKVCAVPHPQALIDAFDEPMPRRGRGVDAFVASLEQRVLPGSMAIGSPRYFGQFNPSPIPIAALTEMVVSVLNQNAGSYLQSPVMTAIEHRTVSWLIERIGFPKGAYGTITSGGTSANLTALKIARDRLAASVRTGGVARLAQPARVYASDQVHFSIPRCLDVLGLGSDALVCIETDANYRMQPAALERAIAADRARGAAPMAIVATAGTTPTGSLDPLEAIAGIAERERVFLHVDAAYGGAALLSDRLRPRLKGIERADSATIDPHKWMMMPNEAGCLLVRDEALLKDSFNEQPTYLADSADRHEVLPDYYRHGLQGSRRARAFRLWATLQVVGLDAIADALERHVALAAYLHEKARGLDRFEVCCEPDFALVCLRFAPPGRSPEQQDELNRRIQRAVEASGEAWFATTVLRGRKVLRINIESFRTTEADVDRTLAAIARAARGA